MYVKYLMNRIKTTPTKLWNVRNILINKGLEKFQKLSWYGIQRCPWDNAKITHVEIPC